MSEILNIKTWRKEWLSLTAIGAILITLFELFLLQRKYSLFSEGFLSVHQLTSPSEILLFIFVSLSANAAILGLITSLLLFASDKIALTHPGKRYIILAISLSPFIVTDFVTYRLASYLGDAFDLSMLFEMVGRSPLEIFAVGFEHFILPLSLFLGLVGVGAFLTWKLKRSPENSQGKTKGKPPMRRIVIESTLLFLFGFFLLSFARITNETFDHGLKRKPSGRLLGYLAETLSDFDGDSYGLLSRPSDPDLFDANIFPYALDIPGNGIDENGVAGDLPIDQANDSESLPHTTQWRYKPHIVFFMLESFRPDALGATYDDKPVTPVLEELAKEGISAQKAFSHNGYTVQSRFHTFTGTLIGPHEGTSLIDDFKKNGYEVAFFSGQDESFGAEKMPIGFERADTAYDARVEVHRRYTKFSTPASLGLPFHVLLERVKAFLMARKSDQPLFLYLNLYDTHFPYHHDGILPLLNDLVLSQFEIQSGRKDELMAMYLNTVANMDRAIGIVLDALGQAIDGEPAVIVASDHGESLFEDDFLGHGYMVNDAQTRIPLIITGLPIVIEEPFGQSELRRAIHSALTELPDESQKPTLRRNPKKQVFQYIGTLERPSQIAMRGLTGRITYDFRANLVQTEGKEWRRPRLLDVSEYTDFQQLVYFWESGLLAKNNGKEIDEKH